MNPKSCIDLFAYPGNFITIKNLPCLISGKTLQDLVGGACSTDVLRDFDLLLYVPAYTFRFDQQDVSFVPFVPQTSVMEHVLEDCVPLLQRAPRSWA